MQALQTRTDREKIQLFYNTLLTIKAMSDVNAIRTMACHTLENFYYKPVEKDND